MALQKALSAKSASGRPATCPPTPNCVSSLDPGSTQYVRPLVYFGEREAAADRLFRALENMGGTVAAGEEGVLRAEFRSRIFGFRDTAEFFFPEGETVIHILSRARTGYWDFGVNRRRIERIRALFEGRP